MKRLKMLMKDEKSAPRGYYALIKQLHRRVDKEKIRGIIRDERRHLKLLKRIKQ